ncbi:hypothetical protein COL32_27655 [Bacillus pseudomycoides]|uniref:hypothetical protein n=1 Tax=Bacillus pseudomycoides TaxID=64104 RepID=UPI000BF57782|nr:hypothetical protein [Bacillus pseudomycoides]PFW87234.1 hypothetical protein COL29_29770 [Bacillus pseudomycoides]PFX37066.1 hypothetical protein COL32_27655 [Bacillus pseudomycoides]
MRFDLTITISVIVSALVTVGLFVFLHYVIEPKKERVRKKEEKLKNLYAPLFTMIITELVSVPVGVRNSRTEMALFTRRANEYSTDNDHFVKFVLDNSRYANMKLLFEIHNFVEAVMFEKQVTQREGNAMTFPIDNLVKVIVKDYNQLKKELKEEYDEEELITGIPNIIKKTRK